MLVLGSMPGTASLREQRYYAHPRNLFWQMVEWHLGIDRALPYDERLRALQACGVALWDVLAACTRPGSLDAAIDRASEEANPVAELITAHPGIRAVLLNGRRAEASFRRHLAAACLAARPDLTVHALPSTSPANQSIPLAERRARWQLLADCVRPANASMSRIDGTPGA